MSKRKAEPNDPSKVEDYTKRMKKRKSAIIKSDPGEVWEKRIRLLKRQIQIKTQKIKDIVTKYDLSWDTDQDPFERKYFNKRYGPELNRMKREIKYLQSMITNYKVLLDKKKKKHKKSSLSTKSVRADYLKGLDLFINLKF